MAASSSKLRAKGSPALPPEVVEEEILERIPIEDVIRFKSICKEWYGLFKGKRFIYKHLHLSQERFIRINHDKVQIFNPATLDLLHLPVPSEFLMGNTATSFRSISIIHCNGLLLCRCNTGRSNRKLAIWNPVLSSRVKLIEPSHPCGLFDYFGFGYDSDNKYKILRFECTGFEIYDLKSKLWRAFPATFDWNLYLPAQNVSMKGNMYWIAESRSNNSQQQLFIQSFDFSRETFKPISSSLPVKVGFDLVQREDLDIVVLSGFGGDRLSLLHQHRVGEIKIEVWVTNKVTDALVSWTKYFNVTRPHLDLPRLHSIIPSHGNPAYFIHKTNGIMLWCDELVQEEDVDYACACFYEIAEGEIIKQVETGPRYRKSISFPPCRCACVYVPSLVPVPE